ncbi:secretin receptor-like isoform X5 [Haemaphysalis longicornis]
MQMSLLAAAKDECEVEDSTAVFDSGGSLLCPQTWDGLLCWRPAPAGTTARMQCPNYVFGFDTSEMATKRCLENGTWFFNQTLNRTWTNYTRCTPEGYVMQSENISIFEPHLATIKLISKVGYTVSLVALVAAFVILASIKRLRCPRNSLHMHLFLSFILRALAFLLKDALFIAGVGLSGNVDFNKENVDCKVFTSFWHYVLMANYCWILMEGLYLHSLVFLAFFTDSSSILRYVALGWGLPVLFIVPWVVVRATLDDTLCWTTNPRQDLFWIIRGPITASIVVNFVLFLNITRVLFAKLFASQTPQARKYRYRCSSYCMKWFKSTLVLVPLFGAHYAFLLGMSLAAAGDMLELVWLYIDQLFSSFQGFVVALLYCFLNGEVQTELRKLIQRWRCDRRGPGRGDKQLQHRHSLFTQSVTFLSRGRSSIQSLHSACRCCRPGKRVRETAGGCGVRLAASSGRCVDKRDGAPKSPSPNSAMKARSSQRLLSNADQLDTPPMKRLSSMEEYHDNPRKASAGGGQEDRTPGSQFKFNGGVGARWDTPEHDHVDTGKNNLLEGVIQKETCL